MSHRQPFGGRFRCRDDARKREGNSKEIVIDRFNVAGNPALRQFYSFDSAAQFHCDDITSQLSHQQKTHANIAYIFNSVSVLHVFDRQLVVCVLFQPCLCHRLRE